MFSRINVTVVAVVEQARAFARAPAADVRGDCSCQGDYNPSQEVSCGVRNMMSWSDDTEPVQRALGQRDGKQAPEKSASLRALMTRFFLKMRTVTCVI